MSRREDWMDPTAGYELDDDPLEADDDKLPVAEDARVVSMAEAMAEADNYCPF